MHRNSNTYHWCHNCNGGNGMWVVHLYDECNASEKYKYQKPTMSENENKNPESNKG